MVAPKNPIEYWEWIQKQKIKANERWENKNEREKYSKQMMGNKRSLGTKRPDVSERMKENKINLGTKRPYQSEPMKGNTLGLANRGKKRPYMSERMKIMRALQVFPVKDTKIEVKIQNFLKQLGIEFFTHQYIKQIEHGYQCDILIPSMNIIIECDGDYWHKYPIGTEIDKIRTRELLESGFSVLRLWESEIKKINIYDFEIKLKNNISCKRNATQLAETMQSSGVTVDEMPTAKTSQSRNMILQD